MNPSYRGRGVRQLKTARLRQVERMGNTLETYLESDVSFMYGTLHVEHKLSYFNVTKGDAHHLLADNIIHEFLQNILDLYFKYFKLPEDVVNRILQVVLDLQHFKSSLVIFAATILQSSSALHHISNIDNYVHQIIEFQSILITSSHSLWSSQSFGHQKAINGFDMPLPVAVCSGLVNPLAPRKVLKLPPRCHGKIMGFVICGVFHREWHSQYAFPRIIFKIVNKEKVIPMPEVNWSNASAVADSENV
ncbi:hypothetical protein Tco_0018405 [Tanacetum coccineum]